MSGAIDDLFITVTDTTINEVERLNIPETGVITIGNQDYAYAGFEVTRDEDTGAFIYSFELERPLMTDVYEATASVGKSINYKGIPYYLDQMNMFIRTYA